MTKLKKKFKCRHCHHELTIPFVDLGFAPPSNAYLKKQDLHKPEIYFPLKVMVCSKCWLAQTIDYASEEFFFNDEYAYFSSTSSSWLEHAKRYVDDIVQRERLSSSNFVVEIASNDGYLLKIL